MVPTLRGIAAWSGVFSAKYESSDRRKHRKNPSKSPILTREPARLGLYELKEFPCLMK